MAVGHRMVMVLAAFGEQDPRIRRLWPAALSPQQCLLEADRLRRQRFNFADSNREVRPTRLPASASYRTSMMPSADRLSFSDWFLANVPIERRLSAPLGDERQVTVRDTRSHATNTMST